MTRIWRFQDKFVEECSTVLNQTLALLGCDIPHRVFLIGVQTQTNAVTVVPNNALVADSKLEEALEPIAEAFVPYPDDQDIPEAEWDALFRAHDASCWKCWAKIRHAVEHLLRATDHAVAVSPCHEVNGYVVVLVATYSKSDFSRYPSLDMRVLTKHGRWPSLLFGAIEAVLDKFGDELRKRDAGGVYENDPATARNVLRTAGAFLTRIHAWAGKGFSALDIQFRGTLELFDACNVISALPQENRAGFGGMVIADTAHPAVNTAVRLQWPIVAWEHKRVRKLLEMCRNGLSLLSDSRHVWGIGTFDPSRYDAAKLDVFRVEFVGHFHWQLWHLNQPLMTVRNGEPRLPMPPVDPDRLDRALRWRFSGIADAAVTQLIGIVQLAATKQEHGTTIVISSIAQSESERLAKGAGVVPFIPDADKLAAVTSIDGAIMLDLEGNCHGVGLILDGMAGEGESPARGARYNSVVRYTRGRNDCIGIVLSVDGGANIIPQQEPAG
jgi:hypothetical protein